MTFDNLAAAAQPICPSCGVTMHPVIEEGIGADECRECAHRIEWPITDVQYPGEGEGVIDFWLDRPN